MKTFRIVASKNNNKVTLINQYESTEDARNDIGRQGYAIIEIGELKEGVTLEGIFFFEIHTPEGVRKGKIKSDDIFRAYVKLVDDLGYKVLFIYDRPDADDAYKKMMTVNIEKSYAIYLEQSGKLSETEKAAAGRAADSQTSFAARKEIERLHAVYAKMLAKAETILNTYRDDLGSDLRNDLNDIVTKIKTIGAISNIDRLRMFGEASLKRIGEAELIIISKRSIKEKKAFLEETNQLLRGVGSHKFVHVQQESIGESLKRLFSPLLERFKEKTAAAPSDLVSMKAGDASAYRAAPISQSGLVKKGSYLYYHVLKDIETYERKYKTVYREWLHALFRLDRKSIHAKRIKLDLIAQNVRLLKARLSGSAFSYTKIVQGFKYYLDAIFSLMQGVADLYVSVFAILAAFFALSYTYATFFRAEIYLRSSFVFLMVVLAAAAVGIKTCRNFWHLVPMSAAFLGFVFLLGVNF